MKCRVESLMRNEVLLEYEVGFKFPKRPYQEKLEARILNSTELQEVHIFPTHTPSVTPETLKPTMLHKVSMISKIKPTNYRTPHQHLNSNLKMPILHSFEENKLEYEDEDEAEIKTMGTGMDKEPLEHNLYENDLTSIICKCKYVTRNTGKERKNEENTDSYENLRHNPYDSVTPRHVIQQDYGITTRKVYAVTLLLWKDDITPPF
ncbi:hypothetical protein Tco_1261186 [Tanacetum coccineum]